MPPRNLRLKRGPSGSDAVSVLLDSCIPNERRTARTTAKWKLIIGPTPFVLRQRFNLQDLYELQAAFPEATGPNSWLTRRITELEAQQCQHED
jgi:hypothetical protein